MEFVNGRKLNEPAQKIMDEIRDIESNLKYKYGDNDDELIQISKELDDLEIN